MSCCTTTGKRAWFEPDPASADREKKIMHTLAASIDFPDAPVDRICVGKKSIALQSEDRAGVSARIGAQPTEGEQGLADRMLGQPLSEAVKLLQAATPFSRCIGLAACNAAISSEARPVDQQAENLVAALGKNRSVGLVGFFPFTDALREQVGELHLFELCDVPGCVLREKWDQVLAEIDVLAVTGTAVITRHLAYFLGSTPKAARIVLGPSTPLSPVLFNYGIDVLAGSVVIDIDCVFRCIEAGHSFRRVKAEGGFNFITLARPGFNNPTQSAIEKKD